MKKETKQSILLIKIILLLGLLGLGYFLLFSGMIDLSTKYERAIRFCENYNLVLDVDEEHVYSCVQVRNDSTVNVRNINYVDGIEDWRFTHS